MTDDIDVYRAALKGEQENNERLVALLEGARNTLEYVAHSEWCEDPHHQDFCKEALTKLLAGATRSCKECKRLIATYDSGDNGRCWRCRNERLS